MNDHLEEFGSEAEKKLKQLESSWEASKRLVIYYGNRIWSTLSLLTGVVGTIVLAQAVQPNPQHLGLMTRENRSVSDVYDLVYTAATSTNQTVFAVINDNLFNIGVWLVILAFVFQFLSIWGGDLFTLFCKGYKFLSSRW